jgi:hypothetical protein
VTDLQAQRRRKPPIKIPVRTYEERRLRRWTGLELAAIAQALAAGRVVQSRGTSGLPEPSIEAWKAAKVALYIAMQGVARQGRIAARANTLRWPGLSVASGEARVMGERSRRQPQRNGGIGM